MQREEMKRYWEVLHEYLERDLVKDLPAKAARKSIAILEEVLRRTPDGEEKVSQARADAGLDREFEITFNIQGSAGQTVRVHDRNMTPQKLQDLLDAGKAQTTIAEGGRVEYTHNGRLIATVISVDNECSYSDFEVEDVT